MEKIWNIVDEVIMRPPAVKVERMPTFYPSAAGCINEEDSNERVGTCLRANYYRCAKYERSDGDTIYGKYIMSAGVMWEKFILDKLQSSGMLRASNLKMSNVPRFISGEIDGVLINPDNEDNTILLEIKTFHGYEAKKNICGNTTVSPKPKDNALLQSFYYLNELKDQVDKIVIMYLARDDASKNEFHITIHEENGKSYPKIETFWRGNSYGYIDKRITIEGIYQNFDDLMVKLKEAELPRPDFYHIYPDNIVESLWDEGKIAKTRYNNWTRNKEKYPIGHFMCGVGDGYSGYCAYRTMCKTQKEEDGDS